MPLLVSLIALLACGGSTDTAASSDTGGVIDADGDGFTSDVDCDDTDPAVHPEAEERCDGLDNDCDGSSDEGDASDAAAWYRDGDSDGYGDPNSTTSACQGPPGYVADSTDCDDTSEAVNPAASEVCNDGLDNDCDGDESACYLSGTIDLEDATALISGESAGVRLGSALSGAGDVDGDGLEDVLVGAPYDNERGSIAGAAYLMAAPLAGGLTISTARATLLGTSAGHTAGSAVSGAGDLDDDGYADLLIGAITADGGGSDSGEAYLVLGPVSDRVLLADTDAKIVGELSADAASTSIAGVGDVNADGLGDLLIGAPGYGDGGFQSRGAAYLVLGIRPAPSICLMPLPGSSGAAPTSCSAARSRLQETKTATASRICSSPRQAGREATARAGCSCSTGP